jgi:hypothetical protein
MDERICGSICVAGDQVGGGGVEGDEANGADSREVAGPARLAPTCVHAHADDGPRPAVAKEHVRGAVRVPGHKARGQRAKRDVGPVGADGWDAAKPVALSTRSVSTDDLGSAGRSVTQEDVIRGVGVAGDKV